MYFTRKKEYISATYRISWNVSSKLSRSTNHTFHGHNFLNTDLYTFALQAKGSPPLLACFPKADFEPTQSEASFIPSLCEVRLPSGPQIVSTARSIERAFLCGSDGACRAEWQAEGFAGKLQASLRDELIVSKRTNK